MKCSPILLALAALILCALSAGCTSPTQTGINTPATTTVPLPFPDNFYLHGNGRINTIRCGNPSRRTDR